MFIRFRPVCRRLVVNLVANRRVSGKVKSEHIARLGSAVLPEPIGARERVRLWRELKTRLPGLTARLGDRVSSDDWRKALALIHRRIPKPTVADEQAARSADQATRRALAAVERQLAESRAVKAAAEQQIAAAQARFVRLNRDRRAASEPAKQRVEA
jgi:hypothetical protein